MKDKHSNRTNHDTINNVSVFILAAQTDFGRCELATKLPKALWPVGGKPALEQLINSLHKQGLRNISICANGLSDILKKNLPLKQQNNVRFVDYKLPTGTAGAVRDAAKHEKNSIIFVIPANIMQAPSVPELVKKHIKSGCEMTALFNPPAPYQNGSKSGNPADIYICSSSVLQYIPTEGYFDIKENLITKILSAGKNIHTVRLKHNLGNFHNWEQYLNALAEHLENSCLNGQFQLRRNNGSQKIWCGKNVKIESSAKIYGTVAIADNACIRGRAIVIGPATIGTNVTIEADSIVMHSALWDNSHVSKNCRINRCVVDYQTNIRANTVVEDKALPFKAENALERTAYKISDNMAKQAKTLQQLLQTKLGKVKKVIPDWMKVRKVAPWLAAAFLTAAFFWSYWPGIQRLWHLWQRSDEYSSGLLVPFLALYVLWSRRDNIFNTTIKPSLWGIPALIAAQGLRIFGLFFMYSSAERLSIVVSITALVLFLFGWKMFKKLATILLFLCLMLPWPNRIETAVTLPLQRWATSSAVFCLELLGYAVTQEGNIINIGDTSVAIAEACNGLRMITAFFVIGTLVALLVRRNCWQKLIIIASSLPIALLCNTIRLTITSIIFTFVNGEKWEQLFHDFGGYAMMPLALAMVVAELWLIEKLTTPPDKEQKIVFARQDT